MTFEASKQLVVEPQEWQNGKDSDAILKSDTRNSEETEKQSSNKSALIIRPANCGAEGPGYGSEAIDQSSHFFLPHSRINTVQGPIMSPPF
jgi:hypothetical protein